MKQLVPSCVSLFTKTVDGLETVNWSDSIKETQKNWIGRSEGTEVEFKYLTPTGEGQKEGKFTIFTTRADTMFGVSFMVLAPESELVAELTSEAQKAEVEEYFGVCAEANRVGTYV